MRARVAVAAAVVGAAALLVAPGFAAALPSLPLRGMSQSCAEWGQAIPGTMGKDYTWPDVFSIEHFIYMGFGAIRVPFLWERLQPKLDGSFDEVYLGHLDKTIQSITRLGAHAIIDPHNYARYSLDGTVAGGQIIGANGSDVTIAHFADLWVKLALHFKENPNVIFGLMNEPRQMSTSTWASAAQAAVQAIRNIGATQLVLVPGNGWTGANSWQQNWYDTDDEQFSNAEVFENFTDPADNFAFEFHQYLDTNGIGSEPECAHPWVGVDRVQDTTEWLEEHNYTGFLGEFATGGGDICAEAVHNLLEHMDNHSQAWLGWAWWAAGPWWKGGPGKPAFDNIEPYKNGTDRPQVEWLKQHITVLTQTTTTSTSSTSSTLTTTSTSSTTVSPPPDLMVSYWLWWQFWFAYLYMHPVLASAGVVVIVLALVAAVSFALAWPYLSKHFHKGGARETPAGGQWHGETYATVGSPQKDTRLLHESNP